MGLAKETRSVETQLRLTPPEEQTNINALPALLETNGSDANKIIDVINALAEHQKKEI